MLAVIGLVLPLFGVILLGYISARLASIGKGGLDWLNFFIVYIALPPLFYQMLSTTPVEEFKNVRFFATVLGVTFAMFCACFLIALLMRRAGTAAATIQGLSGAYGNIGYLGPPLAIAAFGPEAGVPVALIFSLENTMHFTLAPLLMALSGTGGKKSIVPIIAGIVKRIITHPFIIATVIGITAAIYEVRLPAAANQLIDSLAGAAAPCALFAMGVIAANRPLRRIPVAISYVLPIKLLIHPALMYVALSLIPNVDELWVLTAVLMASLPTATNVFVLAQQYKTWEEEASSIVVITTAFSVLTVTALLYIAGAGSA